MTATRLIVADIGGTHIRLAIANGGVVDLETAKRFRVADFDGPAETMRHYLDQTGLEKPDAACLAIAGPVQGRQVSMVNSRWVIDADDFSRQTGITDCRLVNDFEALALSLPSLLPNDLAAIGGGEAVQGNCAVLGPGTGLGVAFLAQGEGFRAAIPCEGGHAGFAPVDDVEIEIHRHLTKSFGRVSNERLVSGPGLENLYRILGEIEGKPRDHLTARAIIDRALANRVSEEWATVSRFCAIFGTIAGDTALLVGAVGGVYLAGGISFHLSNVFGQTPFRQRFEAKGRLLFYTRAIPVHVIVSPYAALTGAAIASANHHDGKS